MNTWNSSMNGWQRTMNWRQENFDSYLKTVGRAYKYLWALKRARRSLGWVATQPKYNQLVHEANKEKRVVWCQEQISKGDKFLNVIWTDECSVQLDNHGRLCFRRKQEKRKLKPRPKHPLKLHIWAGISSRGATPIVIFSGILTATWYCEILQEGFLPFIEVSGWSPLSDGQWSKAL